MRRSGSGEFVKVEGESLFQPVFEGVVFRPFDLQMPFIYWEDFRYEGPDRIGSYAALQNFMMIPPDDSAAAELGVSGVRIGIDDDYNALRRIELIDTEGDVRSEFVAQGFRQIGDQWIVSRVSIQDKESRDRTTFRVTAAALGLDYARGVFDPAVAVQPSVDPAAFEDL